eukprot:Hpha_TRINITY_DN3797_c0_g1::TRINITY_DN3797_c0_g1_i1::g.23892::m.23892
MAYLIAMMCPVQGGNCPQLPVPPRGSSRGGVRGRWPAAFLGLSEVVQPSVSFLTKDPPPAAGSGLVVALCADSDSGALTLAGWLSLAEHITLSSICRRLRGALWSQAAWQVRLRVDYPSLKQDEEPTGRGLGGMSPDLVGVSFDLKDYFGTYRAQHAGDAGHTWGLQAADADDALLSMLPGGLGDSSDPITPQKPKVASPHASVSTGVRPALSPSAASASVGGPAMSPSAPSDIRTPERPQRSNSNASPGLSPRDSPGAGAAEEGLRARLNELEALEAEIAGFSANREAMEREREETDRELEAAAGLLLRRDEARESALRVALARHCTSSALQRICSHGRLSYECRQADAGRGERWSVQCPQCQCAGLFRLTESAGEFIAAVGGGSEAELRPVQAPAQAQGVRRVATAGQASGPPPHAKSLVRTMPPSSLAAAANAAPMQPALAATLDGRSSQRKSWGAPALPPLKASADPPMKDGRPTRRAPPQHPVAGRELPPR